MPKYTRNNPVKKIVTFKDKFLLFVKRVGRWLFWWIVADEIKAIEERVFNKMFAVEDRLEKQQKRIASLQSELLYFRAKKSKS